MERQNPIQPESAIEGDLPFPVVGIGASAGGYAALTTLLQNMPPSPGMALVVILHLAADGPSAADKVLQRATDLPVVQVGHTMRILPDHVYVIPPDRSLAMRDGHLVLDRMTRNPGWPVAIDFFLRTLAQAHRTRAIGVVLSGMGTDGTAGLACVREMGGATIAQLPSDAEYGSMPRSAIDSGMADFVLAAGAMPGKLVELRDISNTIRQRALHGHLLDDVPLDMGPRPQVALRDVLNLLRERTGHDFTHYRRPTLLRRLERRLQVRGMPDLAAYYRLLQRDASEARTLLKDLLIGVTSFYRDREAFDVIERRVLPALFQPGRPAPRAWVAACSSGEEAYSLAMLMADQAARAGGEGEGPDWQVFASDLDEHAVEVARAGLYPAAIAQQVPPAQLERYFTVEADQYKVRRALRQRVLLTRHNLLDEPAFSRLDLISCRNILIYLNLEMHRQVLSQFHFALNPGGYLMLGSAESIEMATDLFEPVDAAQRIYRARAAERTAQARPRATLRTMPPPPPPAAAAGRGRRRQGHARAVGRAPRPPVFLRRDPPAEGGRIGPAQRAAERGGRYRPRVGRRGDLPAPGRRRADARTGRAGAAGAAAGPARHPVPGAQERTPGRYRSGALRRRRRRARRRHPGAALPRPACRGRADAGALPAGAGPGAAGPAGVRGQQPAAPARRRAAPHAPPVAGNDGPGRDLAGRHAHRAGRAADHGRGTARRQRGARAQPCRPAVRPARAGGRQPGTVPARRTERQGARRPGQPGRLERRGHHLPRPRHAHPALHAAHRRLLQRDPGRRRPAAAAHHQPARPSGPGRGRGRGVREPAGDGARGAQQGRARLHRARASLPHHHRPHRGRGDDLLRHHQPQARGGGPPRQRSAAVHDVREPAGRGLRDEGGRRDPDGEPAHAALPADRRHVLARPERGGRWRAWHPDGRPVGLDEFPGARALRGERVMPGIEMLFRQDDGREIWTQVGSAPVIDADGRPIGEVTTVITDIDALKRVEATLRENEMRLRDLMLGFLALMVWETDAAGMVVADSPSWRSFTGQASEEWLGEGWLDAVHPEDRDFARRQWQEAVEQRSVADAEFRLRTADDGWCLTRVRALPLFNVDGSVRKWIGMNLAPMAQSSRPDRR